MYLTFIIISNEYILSTFTIYNCGMDAKSCQANFISVHTD